MKKIAIYMLGIAPVAFFYQQLKASAPSELAFVLLALAYLVALRLVAEKWGK